MNWDIRTEGALKSLLSIEKHTQMEEMEMQIDMHYYGTYAMARAAGMYSDKAKIVATAAQFVDDNAHKESLELKDGARIDSLATAHHAVDLQNINLEDQRRVWVPFHFLPGNEGNEYTERLTCRMDSDIAKEMVHHNSTLAAGESFGLELLGITAHVYEDTFSHYGFSGISSRRNRVINDSFNFYDIETEMKDYIEGKAKTFFKRYGEYGGLYKNIKRWVVSFAGETLSGALGHGAVATYPDRPYLQWDYETEYPEIERISTRNNKETFLLACKQVHQMFRDYLEKCPEHAVDDGVEFGSIEDRVIDILKIQASKEGRIDAWQQAAQRGDLFGGIKEIIPEYKPWHDEWGKLAWIDDSSKALEFSLYRYFQAASTHRNYVLRRLLPSHGLIVK